MAKPIPKVGSRRNGRSGARRRSGARKSTRRIPKGVIHVQASFNNTIVTVTDVRGRVISWSSAGTCGFRGSKKRDSFCCSNRSGRCYSSGSRPRYATSRR
ncbi:Ribosomal protein S11 [Corchorus olitorius]|uniref:Ribosomal protein S11 n=1 Tax=Corchorus olitorius TaxID=93759 RepID=A0A1R3KZN3_9ROSI|nr:Ribosomal protein S11 [Corchorus olitorius]